MLNMLNNCDSGLNSNLGQQTSSLFPLPLIPYPFYRLPRRLTKKVVDFVEAFNTVFPFFVTLIAFVRTHPNLVFLWHKASNFRAIPCDCRLAALSNFTRGISAGKLDSFRLD